MQISEVLACFHRLWSHHGEAELKTACFVRLPHIHNLLAFAVGEL